MKDEKFNKALGIYLKSVRLEKRLTQKDIDIGVGRGDGWYREIERGRNSLLFGEAEKLCAFLDLDIDEVAKRARSMEVDIKDEEKEK